MKNGTNQPLYKLSQLPGGLTVATAEMPHTRSVSVGLWVGAGSRFEPLQLNGACHFIEHLLFKGTHTRSARQISEAVEGVGGYLNAYTSEEVTCFHAKAGFQHFERLLDVLLDMLLGSRFSPIEIRKEREVIKEEIAMYLDEPQHHVQELLNSLLWPNHPLGRPITGTAATLDLMTRSQLVEYLRTHYVAPASVIAVAGRIRHGAVVRAATRRTAKFNGGPRPSFPQAPELQRGPAVLLHSRKTEQTQMALGVGACSRHSPSRFAVRILNTLLGENMSSRLFQVIREERGLAYSIYSSPSFFADTGDLVISAGLEAGNLGRTLRLIMAELRRIKQDPPAEEELQRAKDYVIGQMELSLEGTDNQMNWVGEQVLGYGKVFAPQVVKRYISKLKPSDIQEVARQFLRAERLNLAIVSPLKSDEGLRSILARVDE